MSILNVRLVAPDRVVYEGESTSVVAPAWDGKIGVLPGHAPLITLVGVGQLDIDLPDNGSHRFQIAGGVMKVSGNNVTILTEYAGDELPEFLPAGARIEKEDLLEHTTAGNPFA